MIKLGERSHAMPMLFPTKFVTALDRSGCLHTLLPDMSLQKTSEDNELRLTLPVTLHGDEGRGKKKTGVMIISWQSTLGRGASKSISQPAEVQSEQQRLKFLGPCEMSRHLTFIVIDMHPHKRMAGHPNSQELKIWAALSDDQIRNRFVFSLLNGEQGIAIRWGLCTCQERKFLFQIISKLMLLFFGNVCFCPNRNSSWFFWEGQKMFLSLKWKKMWP